MLPVANDAIMAPFVTEFRMKINAVEIEEQIKEKIKLKDDFRIINTKNSETTMRIRNITLNLTLFISPSSMLSYIFNVALKFLKRTCRCNNYV